MKKTNNKKRQQSALLANIIFSLVALFALTVAVIFILSNHALQNKLTMVENENQELNEYKQEYKYTKEDMDHLEVRVREEENETEKNLLLDQIKETMDNGYSAYYLLRSLFPNDVVVMSNGSFNFFEITDSLKKNNYVLDNFLKVEDSNEIQYVDDNNSLLSHKGIDISSHNGEIDFEKVKNSGVEYVMIRVGFRGSTEGGLVLDSTFEDNIKGANKAGLKVGVYFYTQAVNVEEAKEEAQFVLDAIEPYNVNYPVVFDLEKYEGESRASGLSSEQYTDCAIAFMDTIKAAGYMPMIYGNLNTFFLMLDLNRLENYEKWFAYYIYPVYFPYDFAIWQYTSEGKVDGIDGNVDLNISMKTLSSE